MIPPIQVGEFKRADQPFYLQPSGLMGSLLRHPCEEICQLLKRDFFCDCVRWMRETESSSCVGTKQSRVRASPHSMEGFQKARWSADDGVVMAGERLERASLEGRETGRCNSHTFKSNSIQLYSINSKSNQLIFKSIHIFITI